MKTPQKVASGSKSECDPGNQDPQSEDTMINMYFDMVPDLFCVLSVDKCFKKLNLMWEAESGFTIEEFCSRPLTEFIHPDDVDRTMKAFDDLHNELEYKSFISRFLCKDNSYKWFEWRVKTSNDKSEFYAIARDITEHYQEEETLRESKEKYEVAFNTSPDANAISKMDGTYVDVNQGFTELTGYSKDDVIGRSVLEIGIWANLLDRDHVVETLQKDNSLKDFESVFRTKEGSLKKVLISASLVNINNEPHILSETRDITSRKLTEKTLEHVENRFRQIAENSEDMIWEIDIKGMYTYCNEIVSSILGYKAEEVVGKMHFYDFFEPGLYEELKKEAFIRINRKEKIRKFINYTIHKDGHTVILETNGSPILTKHGKLIGYRGTNTDITKRILAENALRENEKKYRLLAVNTTDVIWTMNLQGEFTYITPSVQKFSGFTPEEAIHKDIDSTLTPESAAIAKQILGETLELIKAGNTQIIRTLILEFYCKNGSTVWGELTVNTYFDDNQQLSGFAGITRDITERRKAEQKLIQAKAAMESASDAIAISDIKNRIIYRNKAMGDLMEFTSAEEFEAAGGWQVLFKDPTVGKEVYNNIRNGKSWEGEIEMVTRNKRVFIAFVRADIIHDDNNNIIGLLGIITDITKFIETREKWKNSEQLFRSLAEYSPNMILILINNKIYYVNQLCEEKLGYSKEELYAPDFDIGRLSSPEHIEIFNKNLSLNTTGKEVEPFEFLITNKGGKVLYTMVNLKSIHIDKENAILGVIVDISELKWAEYILKQKANQVEHFNSIMVERELKMVDLKKEVNLLSERLGEGVRYQVND
jgi:PAS domain S-box-containing protein